MMAYTGHRRKPLRKEKQMDQPKMNDEFSKASELAATMLAAVPGASPIACLIACAAIAKLIIKETCPPECQREASEKFVSDFYEIVLAKD
jgi:hypothetical protein